MTRELTESQQPASLIPIVPSIDEHASQQSPSLLVVLGGDPTAKPGQAGYAAALLKKPRPEEHIDQALNVVKWAVAPVPHDTDDALFRDSRRGMSPNRRQCFRKPA
jgi:hypothetical protein